MTMQLQQTDVGDGSDDGKLGVASALSQERLHGTSYPSLPLLRAGPSAGEGSPLDLVLLSRVHHLSCILVALVVPPHHPLVWLLPSSPLTTVCMVTRLSRAYWMCVKPQLEFECLGSVQPSARRWLLSRVPEPRQYPVVPFSNPGVIINLIMIAKHDNDVIFESPIIGNLSEKYLISGEIMAKILIISTILVVSIYPSLAREVIPDAGGARCCSRVSVEELRLRASAARSGTGMVEYTEPCWVGWSQTIVDSRARFRATRHFSEVAILAAQGCSKVGNRDSGLQGALLVWVVTGNRKRSRTLPRDMKL
ncbi:hypothetical protein EDB83DRAFT_2317367 [Lactarius deliciosus]|nr:hypothetical protein EDB83DRAFT_2317367 [Lactarius deliciosus]